MRPTESLRVIGVMLGVIASAGLLLRAQHSRPTFRADVSTVSLNVVVKDNRGRPITDLAASDFHVLDQGRAVQISDFRSGEEPVSIALLIDTSGSMRIETRLTTARQAAYVLLAQFRTGDEAALFIFDRSLRVVAPFSTDTTSIRKGLDRIEPFGSTSLHDAVAAAARGLAGRPSSRRAVVAISDGLDNSSDLSAQAASGVASSSDVPIYVLAITSSKTPASPGDASFEPVEGGGVARLDELTARTGGASFEADTALDRHLAVRHILADLRSGYVLTFTPHDTPGWHPLTVQVARKDVRVRTRAGFWVGSPSAAR